MYKRPAHIVFVTERGQAAAPIAAALANALGADWVEARAAGLTPSRPPHDLAARLGAIAPAPIAIHPLSAQLKTWADLLVYFDAALATRLQPVPASTQLKHWPLAHDPEVPTDALTADLRQRVSGMIGGMRMLSRLSAEADD